MFAYVLFLHIFVCKNLFIKKNKKTRNSLNNLIYITTYLKNQLFISLDKCFAFVGILDRRKDWYIIWISCCFLFQVKLINSYYFLTKALIKSVYTEAVRIKFFSENLSHFTRLGESHGFDVRLKVLVQIWWPHGLTKTHLRKSFQLYFQFYLWYQRNLFIKESLICLLSMSFREKNSYLQFFVLIATKVSIPLKCTGFLL